MQMLQPHRHSPARDAQRTKLTGAERTARKRRRRAVRLSERLGRTAVLAKFGRGQVFRPRIWQRWQGIPERYDPRDAPILSEFHDGVAARENGAIGPDDCLAEAGDIQEAIGARGAYAQAIRPAGVTAGNLLQD